MPPSVPRATRSLDPPDRSRLLAANLLRFSPLALAAVLLYRVVSHGHILLIGWSTVAARSTHRLPFRADRPAGWSAGDHRSRGHASADSPSQDLAHGWLPAPGRSEQAS